ncbi:MAG TPA: hypothetical protein VEA69_20710, partial [Tepidisphaeraceae bacterium]|nr:hypothetical protein [Tepidisphaeraceae bacterium]
MRAAHAGGLFGGGGGANRGADGAAAPVAGRTTGQPDPLPPAAEDWSPPRWSGKPTPLAREMPGRVARLAAALQEAVPARQADRPALGVRWADALRDAGNLPAAERALLVPELLRVTLSGVPRVNASEPLHRLATDPGGHAMLVRVVSEETDPAVRAAAVILLERADLDLLLRLAADDREHWWVRAQAIGHAAHQAAPDRAAADRAAAVAAAGLGHPSPEVRTQALRVLYRPGAGALPTGGEANVLARLRDPHPGVSAAAFDWVLGTGRHADPQVRQAVLAAMADGFGTDRAAALRRAGVFPTDEVTALARDLRAGSPAARRQAVDRAAQLGAAARADLTNVARLAFADVDPGVARAAERAMGAVLEKSRLASHRNPPDVAAREAHAHVDAVLAVILAPDVDPRAKRHAINELSRCTSAPTMGGLPPTPIPLGQMKQILLRSDRTMRDRVPPFVTGDRSDADTLALFAWAMSDAAPADVRRDLPQWLRPAPAFAALVRDPDPVVRLRAIDVPAHRLQTGLRADVLMPLLADPDVEVRAAAAEQIRDAAQTATSKPVVPPAQLPALLARLKAAELDKDLATREAAGAVLVRLNARPAPPAGAAPRPPAPVALLADRTQSSRTRAAVLGQIDPRGAISGAGL